MRAESLSPERRREIATIANAAAVGAFRASDRERELGIIQLNCSALVHLTHLYLPGMLERRSGAILIVSSTAAYQGVPYKIGRAHV